MLFLLFNTGVFAQEIYLSGEQKRGTGQNAELVCEAIIITDQMQISIIEGDNAGFWIANESATIQSFFKEGTEFFPPAKGFILEPGKYWVYPNLRDNQEKATVKITLLKTE